MNVGIFETEHFEGIHPVIRLFDNGSNRLTVFTYAQSYRQLEWLLGDKLPNYDWIVKKDSASKYRFIYTIYKEVKKRKIKLLYLNTVSNNFIFYAALIKALPKVRIVLTLHDINGYFPYRPQLGLRSWVRYLGKRRLINAVNEFNVVAITMVDYLKGKLPSTKKIHCVPGAVFDENNLAPNREPRNSLQLVVPGTLDWRRRNYETVFELLEGCNLNRMQIDVTLLGGYSPEYGSEILEKCRTYSKEHHNLRYYETILVDQPEFDRVMDETQLVLIPSAISTIISDGVLEKYGTSISSGNIFDAIKHAKPVIAPIDLKIEPYLASSCFQYENTTEIVEFLKGISVEPEKLEVLKFEALRASRNYTIEKVRSRNPGLFGKIE